MKWTMERHDKQKGKDDGVNTTTTVARLATVYIQPCTQIVNVAAPTSVQIASQVDTIITEVSTSSLRKKQQHDSNV